MRVRKRGGLGKGFRAGFTFEVKGHSVQELINVRVRLW